MDEAILAEKVHHYVAADRAAARRIVLSGSNAEIQHRISGSGKHQNRELVEAWEEHGDHKLLMRLLSFGVVPQGDGDDSAPDNPVDYPQAQRTALSRGYHIPENYLTTREISRGQREAWHAAQCVVRGIPGLWSGDAESMLRELRKLSICVRGEFIVGLPEEPSRPPYFLDQLWIVRSTRDSVRLIALEIDGFDKDSKNMALRDERLASLGYEVYRVDGTWCTVDSFRVICEFLSRSGIFPDAIDYLLAADFESTGDYVCGLCKRMMIRRDTHWIQRYNDKDRDDSPVFVHHSCLERQSQFDC